MDQGEQELSNIKSKYESDLEFLRDEEKQVIYYLILGLKKGGLINESNGLFDQIDKLSKLLKGIVPDDQIETLKNAIGKHVPQQLWPKIIKILEDQGKREKLLPILSKTQGSGDEDSMVRVSQLFDGDELNPDQKTILNTASVILPDQSNITDEEAQQAINNAQKKTGVDLSTSEENQVKQVMIDDESFAAGEAKDEEENLIDKVVKDTTAAVNLDTTIEDIPGIAQQATNKLASEKMMKLRKKLLKQLLKRQNNYYQGMTSLRPPLPS